MTTFEVIFAFSSQCHLNNGFAINIDEIHFASPSLKYFLCLYLFKFAVCARLLFEDESEYEIYVFLFEVDSEYEYILYLGPIIASRRRSFLY